MVEKTLDIVGIGNAIVDILAYKDTAFLDRHNLPHSSMTLMDEAQINAIYDEIGAATECSGGAAANTLAGYAMLGGSAAFIGRVKNDSFGIIFRKDITRSNVVFDTPPVESGDGTGRCLVLVTEEEGRFGNPPKVERTMATYLGAATQIGPEDIDPDVIRAARVLFFEGYLWDSPSAREAILAAIEIAEGADTQIAFTLSDFLCVERHKDAFHTLIQNHVDILFANEGEIETLLGEVSMRKNLFKLQQLCGTGIVTRSEKGAYIVQGEEITAVDAHLVETVYDVTGAGDLFAAGFLYGYLRGWTMLKAGNLGSLCASEVIKYLGARPVTNLTDLITKA